MAYERAYNMKDPQVRAYIDKHFPALFADKRGQGTPPALAAKITHEYNSYFHTKHERFAFRQLMEEGRIVPEQIESEGMPESFGELVQFLAHEGAMPGGMSLPISKGKKGEPPAGTPKTYKEESAPERGTAEANNLLSAIKDWIEVYGIRALEVIGGALLILFGLYQIGRGSLPQIAQ